MSLRTFILLWLMASTIWVAAIWTYGGTRSIPDDEVEKTDPVEFFTNQQREYCPEGYEDTADEERLEFCERLADSIQRVSEDPSIVTDTFAFEIVPLHELFLQMLVPPILVFVLGIFIVRYATSTLSTFL